MTCRRKSGRLAVDIWTKVETRHGPSGRILNCKTALGRRGLSRNPLLDSLWRHPDLVGQLSLATKKAARFFN